MLYDYAGCHVCGEQMTERLIKQDFWIKEKLIVVEDVPTDVCPRCGEKIVKADVGRQLANIWQRPSRSRKARTMNVPIIRFEKQVALNLEHVRQERDDDLS